MKNKQLVIIWFPLLSLLTIIGVSAMLIAQVPQVEARATFDVATEAELEAAITAANNNGVADTITLTNNITLTGPLSYITSEITLDGAGHYVDGAGSYAVFEVDSPGDFTVQNVTIQNGNAFAGGGILLYTGALTVIDCTFDNNLAVYGGGIANYNGDALTVTGSTFTNNTAATDTGYGGGAIYSYGGTVTITGSTFTGNFSLDSFGGAIHVEEFTLLSVSDSTFTGNIAPSAGAMYINSLTGAATIDSSVFADNEAGFFAGAVYNQSSLTITNTTFNGNSAATSGGGAIINSYILTVDSSSFVNNSTVVDAGSGGGAILNYSWLEVTNSTFSSNFLMGTGTGGAIFDSAGTAVTLVYSTFSGNTAGGGGNALADLDANSTWYIGGVIIENGGAGNNCAWAGTIGTGSSYNFSDDGSCNLAAAGAGVDNATLTLNPLSGSGPGQQVHMPTATSDNVGGVPSTAPIPIGYLSLACDGSQVDQLGYTRPINTGDDCTGGAVEWDAEARLSINNVSVTEGNSGTVTAQFTITASTTSAQNITVQVDTADNTATTADSDYVALVGQTATITAGNLTTTVDVTVNGDTAVEPNETFFVNLSNPTNAIIIDAQGVGTILNDDIDCSIPLTTQANLDACIAWANGHTGADTLTLGSNITLTSALTNTIDTEITLDGQSAYYVSGAGSYRVFEVTATGDFTAQNVTIRNGSGSGGGIYTSGPLTVVNGAFINNTSVSQGSAIYSTGSTVDITNSTFTNNMAVYGGAIYIVDGDLTVTGSTFTDNSATAYGGAIQTLNGTVSLDSSTFTTNDSGGLGGAIYAEGFTQFTLTGGTFTENSAQAGGAVHLESDGIPASIDDSVFSYNEATNNYGGALYNISLLTLTNSTFDHNTAADDGGGAIVNAGSSYIGIDSSLAIDNCSFVSNSAASSDGAHGGGAIFTTTTLTITNSTFSDNALTGTDTGGAIYDNQNTGGTTLIYTTFSGNSAAGGGNALGALDGVTQYNFAGVIIENGGAGNNCAGSATFNNQGYNFADDATCNFGAGNNATLILGALTGSGNGQQVHVPESGSANIGAITYGTTVTIGTETLACNGTQNDQRGTLRPPTSNGPCTSGAVEFVSLPTLSINDVSVAEGNSGTTTAQFTVTASKTWGTDITVQVDTANNTAAAGSDYTALTAQTATITAGNLTTTVNVTISGDTMVELNEQYYVNLSNPSGATIADAQGIGTITNDDSATLSITGATVNPEGNSGSANAVFSVTLTGAVDTGVSVNFTTADFTATAGADYSYVSGVLNFSGSSGQVLTISVPVLGDTLDEDDETFTVGLSGLAASGREVSISISGSPATGTIIDDDNPPTLSINDVNVSEGNGTASFTISLSALSGKTVTVSASTMNGTAISGSDFTGITGQTVTIPAGSLSTPFIVTILEDNVYEGLENYTVVLTGPSNATLGDASGLGEITDNDSQPVINISDATPQNEGNSGTTAFSFTVTLTNPSSQSVSVQVNTADGTATTADNDYQALAGQTLTFTPGQISQPVTVNVNGDTTYEPDETFTVNLSTPTNATISDGQGTGTILNDDAEPSPQFTWTGGPITSGCSDRQTQIPVLLENMRTDTEYILDLVVYNGSGQYFMSRRFAQTPRQTSGTFVVLLYNINDFLPSGLTKVDFPITGTVEVETRLWDSTHTVDITDFIVHGYDCSTGGYSSIDTNP